MKQVLFVEDEADIRHLVELHLRDLGCGVTLAECGPSGLDLALSRQYDLVILDLRLPGIDGLEICRQIRAQQSYTPILMLTARSSEIDRVLGLECGADDYLTKPFSVRELIARVKAIFRRVEAMGRSRATSQDESIRLGDLTIDPAGRQVRLRRNPIELTAKEFDLLLHFALNPGRVYTRGDLLDQVWGYGYNGYEHTVNSHINRLRAKLEENAQEPRYIVTVWGVGYKLRPSSEMETETAGAMD